MNRDPAERLLIASDAVLLRLGRNLLIFQRIEGNLKALLASRSVSAPISELTKNWQAQAERTARRSLGMLTGDYVDAEDPSDAADTAASPTPHLSIHHAIHWGSSEFIWTPDQLKALVESRNALAHLFLEQHELDSLEGCERALDWLDEQYSQAIRLLKRLRLECETVGQGWTQFAEMVQSPEFPVEFERAWLRGSLLIHAFANAFIRLKRGDDWAVFSTAAQHVRAELPEEIAEIKPRYGHRSLKALILASAVFETREEETARGGKRLLYRIRNEWSLEPADQAPEPIP